MEWLARDDLAGGDGEDGQDGQDGQGVPTGGTAGQVLSKVDGTDFNTAWTDAPQSLPTGGTAGQVLSKIDGTDFNTEWTDPPAGGGGTPDQQSLTGTYGGGNTTYTLPNAPTDPMEVIGFLGGVFQVQGVHYTISGQTVTFAGEDTTADNFNCFYRY